MLTSIEAYSRFVYDLIDHAVAIESHTVAVYPRGATLGVLEGEIRLTGGVVLRLFERLDFARRCILTYSYEVWQDQQQMWWCDPMPPPNAPDLQQNHPHHKHIPPDIKHHRVVAPEISFTRPNLPFVLAEAQRLAAP